MEMTVYFEFTDSARALIGKSAELQKMGDPPASKSKEDREVEAAVQALQNKVQGVKGSLSSFVGKMEHEPLTWPSVLDSFSATMGHFSTLLKQLTSDKTPPLSNRVIIPLQVSSERDPELERATESRVPTLHHEIVPNYLRTKLDLDLEAKQRKMVEEARAKEAGLKEEIRGYNSIISSCQKMVAEAREEMEEQRSRTGAMQTTTSTETRKLVAAYLHGNGLTPLTNQRKAVLVGGRVSRQPIPGGGGGGGGKAPSAMKTDVKEAAAPYALQQKQRRT